MEKRKFEIFIDQRGWHLTNGVRGSFGDSDIESIFGHVSVKDGKVCFLGEIGVWDRMIEEASELDIMQEVCIFEDKNTGRILEGSFIEALKYIQANFPEENQGPQKPHWRTFYIA